MRHSRDFGLEETPLVGFTMEMARYFSRDFSTLFDEVNWIFFKNLCIGMGFYIPLEAGFKKEKVGIWNL